MSGTGNCKCVRGRVASYDDVRDFRRIWDAPPTRSGSLEPRGTWKRSTTLRRIIGILEILLALAFFGGLIETLIKNGTNIGLVGLLDDLVLFVIGAVFVKLAISNLKPAGPK
jgi:hypothetical protein